MERKSITCPESAHLEQVEIERTRFGLVVTGCSRFSPPCAVQCNRECARRMDARERLHVDDRSERVLVVYATATMTRPVAEALADELRRDGLTVELANVDTPGAPSPHDYDAVVIGSPFRFRRHARSIVDYVAGHREALATMPAFLFAVSGAGHAQVGKLRRATGWQPTRAFGIARPNWLVRWFGDPQGSRAPRVRDVARTIADDIPSRDPPA